jgi:hypothetical protein
MQRLTFQMDRHFVAKILEIPHKKAMLDDFPAPIRHRQL